MNIYSWSNFWVDRRKAMERERLVVEVCYHFGFLTLHSFLSLPKSEQDRYIEQYKLGKGTP